MIVTAMMKIATVVVMSAAVIDFTKIKFQLILDFLSNL